jgi:hypothetical protein
VNIGEAELLLARFSNLEKCLGKEFLILFTVNQIVIIFSIYNTITGTVSSKYCTLYSTVQRYRYRIFIIFNTGLDAFCPKIRMQNI